MDSYMAPRRVIISTAGSVTRIVDAPLTATPQCVADALNLRSGVRFEYRTTAGPLARFVEGGGRTFALSWHGRTLRAVEGRSDDVSVFIEVDAASHDDALVQLRVDCESGYRERVDAIVAAFAPLRPGRGSATLRELQAGGGPAARRTVVELRFPTVSAAALRLMTRHGGMTTCLVAHAGEPDALSDAFARALAVHGLTEADLVLARTIAAVLETGWPQTVRETTIGLTWAPQGRVLPSGAVWLQWRTHAPLVGTARSVTFLHLADREVPRPAMDAIALGINPDKVEWIRTTGPRAAAWGLIKTGEATIELHGSGSGEELDGRLAAECASPREVDPCDREAAAARERPGVEVPIRTTWVEPDGGAAPPAHPDR